MNPPKEKLRIMLRKLALCLLNLICLSPLLAQTPAGVERVDFYQSGEKKFEALLADMQQARNFINVEYFIFANDQIADRLLTVMRRKAREGVKVRLIIDGYYDVDREYNYSKRLGMLRGDGIEVYIYNPFDFPYINHVLRDHRKIVVIDGRIGYTGGFNVADYNIHGKPGIYGSYVDTHVRLEGAVVSQLNNLFFEHFNRLSDEDNAAVEVVAGTGKAGRAAIVARGKYDGRKKEMRKAVISFIDNANHDLYIQSPYLLPTPGVRRALRRAIQRGVKVHVMFSKKGDTPSFDLGNISYARKLQRKGAEVWLYQDAFLHSKVLTADGESCMVGSMNLDYRALRWNEEVGAVLYGSEPANWLDSAFVAAKENCVRMNDDYYSNLSRKTRISGHLIEYLLSWCL